MSQRTSTIARTQLSPVRAETGKPLYVVARDAIRRAIDDGQFEPGERMPSTAQISREMNVSLVTAHRALGELVGDGLLQRSQGRGTFVRKAANGNGRSLRAMGRVGLVVHRESSLADHYHAQVLEGVRRAARSARLDLVLLRFDDDLRGECDGFLYVNPLPDEVADIAKNRGKACVVVGAAVDPASNVTAVDVDNVDLGRRAARHLIELGHRRLGYVGSGGDATTSNAEDRWRGFREEARSAGFELDDQHVMHDGGWKLDDDGRQKLQELLENPQSPTAIFAAGYYYALDCYAAATAARRSVPHELSLVGVDDPPSAAHLSPALTTLRQPLVNLGETAVAQLLAKITEESPVAPPALTAQLVVRGSTAPATS
ncbi:MAG: GntR family transcriptional regulator [Planctomycetota bacterium]